MKQNQRPFDPKKYGNYTHGEIVYIIKLSAALRPVEEIIDRFYTFTGRDKRVTGDIVLEIQADFTNRITRESEIYLKNIEGNPLAHDRIVLDILWDIVRECRKPMPSHTIKIADNQYDIVEKCDNDTAIKAIKLAIDHLNTKKKMSIEEERRKPPVVETVKEDEPMGWEISDGIT